MPKVDKPESLPPKFRPKVKPRLVNRPAVGTHLGKLICRSSGAYARPGGVLTPEADGDGQPARGTPNDIRCDGEVVEIESLTPDPMNARLHPVRNMDAIRESLILYGQRSPLVVRLEDRKIAAGNGRYQAAKDLGWTRIAVSIRSMTDAEFIGFALADNKSAELARWDFEAVARARKLQEELGGAMVGWSPAELLALRGMLEVPPDADQLPDQVEVISEAGTLWELGGHRLLCGDSADPEAVRRLMGKNRAVLMATDPPYGVDFGEVKYNPCAKEWAGIEGDRLQGQDLRNWLAGVFLTWLPHVTQDVAFYTWCASMGEGHRMYEAMLGAGIYVQAQLVWVKNLHTMGQADYHWKHEVAWYGFIKGARHRWFGGRDKYTVWEVKKDPSAAYRHPTQKPVELFTRALDYHTRPGEVCAEPFAGSGSQIIAAEMLRRRCFAMELDPVWVDVAVRRWELFTGKKARRLS
jgi:DNA modification methylase